MMLLNVHVLHIYLKVRGRYWADSAESAGYRSHIPDPQSTSGPKTGNCFFHDKAEQGRRDWGQDECF